MVFNHHQECECPQPSEMLSHFPLELWAACQDREGAVWETNSVVPWQSVTVSLNITYCVREREQEKSMRRSNKSTVQWRYIFLRKNFKKFFSLFFFFLFSFFPPPSALSAPSLLCLSLFLCYFQYASQLLSLPLFMLAGWVFLDEGKGTFCWPTYQIISCLVNSGGGNPNLSVLNLSFLSLGLYFEAGIGCCWLCCWV